MAFGKDFKASGTVYQVSALLLVSPLHEGIGQLPAQASTVLTVIVTIMVPDVGNNAFDRLKQLPSLRASALEPVSLSSWELRGNGVSSALIGDGTSLSGAT